MYSRMNGRTLGTSLHYVDNIKYFLNDTYGMIIMMTKLQ